MQGLKTLLVWWPEKQTWINKRAASNFCLQLDNFLDKHMTLDEQPADAAKLPADLVLATCNALAAQNVASKQNFTLPSKTYAQLKADFAKQDGGAAGSELYKKIIQAAKEQTQKLGCFVAGTLVHTKDGLKPIEQVKVGDWVLSRPENPEQGTETGYKRVTKTFRFEDKEVVRFWWAPNAEAEWAQTESVYVTPNHPVWLNPNGWVAMGRLTLPEKRRPGFIMRGDGDWLTHELILADGTTGSMLDVFDLYRTDKPTIAFKEEDDWDLGTLYDFSGISPTVGDSVPYDYEKWGDPVNETRERYTTTVYNFEVEDWHTYFVGKMGLWVHNTSGIEKLDLPVTPAQPLDKGRQSLYPVATNVKNCFVL